MFRYTALIVLPALVWSCCPPSKWEGTEYIALGSTDGKGQGHYTEIEQNVTVDTDMRRVFITQQLAMDGQGMEQKILQDYGSGEQYVTTTKDGMEVSCTRMPINSIEPGCVPKNHTKIVQSYFGAGSSKVMATMYKFSMGQNVIYATMSDDGCIPLAYEATGATEDGGGYQMTVEFFGITPGVASTSVFETPKNCPMPRPVVSGLGK
ncbi:ependymin-related protein 1-like [Mytilus californianus]|uniref:ependymin-related protein 1-like n=1 Tax=Mytilus californianus TaxID=6549 RepID=UPI002246B027|nr:ependymin-related protein 1-like [Mytilus californianus]